MKEATKKSIKAGLKAIGNFWSKLPNPVQTIIVCTTLTALGVPTEVCQAVSGII